MDALVVYALLPASLQFLGRFVIPGVEVMLLVALIVTNPRRLTGQTRRSRNVSIGLAVLVIVSNLLALGLLIADLSSKAPWPSTIVWTSPDDGGWPAEADDIAK